MSRRQRHLTLRPSLGAALQLDSRAVAESVGSTVQAWPDRSGFGRNPTQPTTTARATVVADAGGQKCLSFDGGDFYDIASTAAVFNGIHNGGAGLVVVAARPATPATPAPDTAYTFMGNSRGATASTGFALIWENRSAVSATSAIRIDVVRGAQPSFAAQQQVNNQWPGATWRISRHRIDVDATERIITNMSGGPDVLGSTSSGAPSVANASFDLQIGGLGGTPVVLPYVGLMGVILVWPNQSLTSAMQRRIEHAVAYSFKIACA
jgi:hypothetical protein